MKQPISITLAALTVLSSGVAQTPPQRQAVIDMHLHALPLTSLGENNPAARRTAQQHRNEVFAELKRWNVVKAVTSGPIDLVMKWKELDPDRIIASPLFPFLSPVCGESGLDRRRHGPR